MPSTPEHDGQTDPDDGQAPVCTPSRDDGDPWPKPMLAKFGSSSSGKERLEDIADAEGSGDGEGGSDAEGSGDGEGGRGLAAVVRVGGQPPLV